MGVTLLPVAGDGAYMAISTLSSAVAAAVVFACACIVVGWLGADEVRKWSCASSGRENSTVCEQTYEPTGLERCGAVQA
ncbi:hypothetical protein BC835DRAFT_810509 [Cytidiella melzeri]|nr:hypothetical protein BC835DRAFT_810509 [Cytidiella melzeri]